MRDEKALDLFRRNEHPAEVEDDAVELFEKVHSERTEIGLFGCGAEVSCDGHLFQGAGAVADREGYILQVVTRTSQNSAELLTCIVYQQYMPTEIQLRYKTSIFAQC